MALKAVEVFGVDGALNGISTGFDGPLETVEALPSCDDEARIRHLGQDAPSMRRRQKV